MLQQLLVGFALVAVTAIAAVIAGILKVPHAIVLVLLGLTFAFVPGLPPVGLDPELVLLLFLPPLLYSSGVGLSWRGFKANLGPILLLAIGCVLFTAATVAAAAHWLLGIPWAAGFVLGAVVSPPDAVAPMAIVKRLALPSRIIAILEGEGLVNDATALILFGFAAAAVTTGSISVGTAAISFLSIVAGELAWGLAVGWATLHVRHRSGGPQVEITLALLTPFLAFWPPHALGGSGVLATVAAGLYVSWNGPRFIQPATRLQGFFVWNLVVFLIEGLLFLVTGLQARQIVQSLSGSAWQQYLGAALIISLVVVIVRFMWVFPATYLPRYLVPRLFSRHPAPNWRTPFVISFTGVRGVVSLGAALSIPVLMAGQPFPERDLILFVTFFVILVTLIGQGLSLPWLVRRLGLATEGRREAMAAKRRELGARVEGVDAVLAQLDEMERRGAPAALVKTLRRRHTDRRAHLAATADEAIPGSPAAEEAMLQLQLVEAERARIARLYAAAAIDDDARRRIERELDLEDARVHHAAESASGFSDEELCLAMRNGGDPAHGFPAAV